MLALRSLSRARSLAALGAAGAAAATAAGVARCAPASEQPAEQSHDLGHPLGDGPERYIVYARRVVQAFLVKGRLVAYGSDIGESVRPVVPQAIVRACYGVTMSYMLADVVYNTHTEYQKGSEPSLVARTAAHAATFQLVCNLTVPTVIIHQAVHTAQNLTKAMPPMAAKWIPPLVGLSLIPLMPFIDEPAEHAIDWAFDKAWPLEGGGGGHGHGGGGGGGDGQKEKPAAPAKPWPAPPLLGATSGSAPAKKKVD